MNPKENRAGVGFENKMKKRQANLGGRTRWEKERKYPTGSCARTTARGHQAEKNQKSGHLISHGIGIPQAWC
jgi:hypothetical protein